MSAGPMAPLPLDPAKDGNPVATRSCVPLRKSMRVMEPVVPRQGVVPFEVGMHGPVPPVPASATNRSPLGENAIPLGLLRPLAITSAARIEVADSAARKTYFDRKLKLINSLLRNLREL